MSKPLDFFKYRNSELCVANIPIADLAKQYGTPLYVYHLEGFIKPIQLLQSGLKGTDHLICFAVKSCSNIHLLKKLGAAGAGMDLVSGGELFRVGEAGIPGQKIVFSGVGKTAQEIEQALHYDHGQGVYSFNAESIEELLLISEIAKREGKQARVALRFNPDVDPKTHPYISTGLKKNKFGLNRKEILSFVSQSSKVASSLKIRGISIHIGSQILSLSPFADAFEKTKSLALELNSLLSNSASSRIDTIDVGGGIGVTYKNEKTIPIQKYTQLIKKTFGDSFRILLEPGRSISANAGILVSEVLYKKPRNKKQFLVIDASMTELIRPALYQSYHSIVPVQSRYLSGKKIKTDIVGPVCESSDSFASDRLFSASIPNGELVALLSTGAYGFSMASQYNSRPRPAEILVDKNKVRLIRRRETFEDLVVAERNN